MCYDCYLLYKYYGTTMAGLKAGGYDFDYDDYHSFVHGRLPYELLKPDPVLKKNPTRPPYSKSCFHKFRQDTCFENSLTRLGLEDCFDRIICFETINPIHKVDSQNGSAASASKPIVPEIFDIMKYAAESNSDVALPKTPVVCKPFEDLFERVFKIAYIDPERTLFFDDSIHNLNTAKQMGLHTVLVGSSHRLEGIDYALESIHNIKEAFPELLEADDKAGER